MIRSKPYHEYTDFDLEPGGLRKLDYIVEKIEKSFARNHSQISILDASLGRGNISRPLAFLDYQVTGLDVQVKAIEDLTSKNPPGNLKTIRESFGDFRTNERFEVIIMSEFLERTENPEEVLKKAWVLLKNNGILIIIIPNGLTLEETAKRLLKLKSNKERSTRRLWPLMAYKNVIRGAGFNILEVKPTSFLFKDVYYLLGRFLIKKGSWLFHQFDKIDSSLARFVPLSLASGWVMVAKK